MKTLAPLTSALLLTAALLAGCGKDQDKDAAPGDGTVTWTNNGKTYSSTTYSSAIVDGADKLIITGAPADQSNNVSLTLVGLSSRGPGVYELKRGSVLDNHSVAGILVGGSAGQQFVTLYAPTAVNGSVTVTRYDRAAQQLEGTFSYTAGALPNSGASGTQTVTNGSFSFSRLR